VITDVLEIIGLSDSVGRREYEGEPLKELRDDRVSFIVYVNVNEELPEFVKEELPESVALGHEDKEEL